MIVAVIDSFQVRACPFHSQEREAWNRPAIGMRPRSFPPPSRCSSGAKQISARHSRREAESKPLHPGIMPGGNPCLCCTVGNP